MYKLLLKLFKINSSSKISMDGKHVNIKISNELESKYLPGGVQAHKQTHTLHGEPPTKPTTLPRLSSSEAQQRRSITPLGPIPPRIYQNTLT